MYGIMNTASRSANVSCNHVSSHTVTDTLITGIGTSISYNTNVYCNNVDSTGFGFFFGGICLGAKFKGNAMWHHFNALRLNSVAVIDTQAHAGNTWNAKNLVVNGNWDAVNYNANSFTDLALSLFTVNQNSPGIYLPQTPIVNPNNVGWFKLVLTGSEYGCASSTVCNEIDEDIPTSDELRLAIINDSALTVDFIEPSKVIAKQNLFGELSKDSIASNSNSSYEEFMAENTTEAIGKIYNSKVAFAAGEEFTETDKIAYANADSLIELFCDSIHFLENNYSINSYQNLLSNRLYYINEINLLYALKNNLIETQKQKVQTDYNGAITNTASVISIEIPIQNQKILNEIQIDLKQNGIDVLQNWQGSLQEIASMCPYIGGEAVYQARSYLSLNGDSLLYDDATICAANGIYKIKSTSFENCGIHILPNPAKDQITIHTNLKTDEAISLEIKDVIGKLVLITNCKLNNGEAKISLEHINQGTFFINIGLKNGMLYNGKIILIR
ncbi:MAG: T9SS type A sorting domain-containing protein [Bacteroidetes bacterium]|nr:T9SS type A sorting domain-containing protein [Bacteroidota bacterium]